MPESAFVWGGGGARKTPADIAREREVADALLSQGMDYSPVASWTQGLARVANAAAGAYRGYRANQAEKEGRSGADKVIAALLGGDAPAAAPQASGGSDIVPPSASGPDYAPRAVTAVPQQPGGVGSFTEATQPRQAMASPDFVSSIAPAALEASQRTGVDPRIIVAQAALESNWGKSAPGNNLFGIKSHGQEGGNTLATTEVINGQPVRTNASFRAYSSPADSVSGYADFINENPRYAAFKAAQGMDDQINALGASGYATDPNYAAKIRSIASGLPEMSAGAPAAPVQQVANRGNGRINQLLTAANNPWLSDGQRMVIGALLKQEMERNDPGAQLDLQYKQAQIDALRNKGQPRSWSKLDDNTLYDATTGETKSVRDAGETPMFSGTSVEAQALNGLVKSGELTPEQALQLGAGKTVTGPNGEIIFMTPQGVFSRPAAGGAQGDAPQSGPVQQNGMIPITDPKVSESQKNAMTYADRMIQSGKLLDDLGTAGTGLWDNIAVGIPVVGNSMVSPEFQKVDQAKRDFINAQLRRESGAAISQSEFDNAERQYFPQRGDSPEVVAQKAANRRTVIEGMRRDAGPTYQPPNIGGEDGVPEGVDPGLWKYMSPEDRKLWQ